MMMRIVSLEGGLLSWLETLSSQSKYSLSIYVNIKNGSKIVGPTGETSTGALTARKLKARSPKDNLKYVQ